MNSHARNWTVVTVSVVALMVPAAFAWACVGIMVFTTSASSVAPGGTVLARGGGFAQDAPIDIHLDSPTGLILATVPPPPSTMTSRFEIPVTIPADVPTGSHLLVATQAYHHMNAGAPARATIYVGPNVSEPAVPAPTAAERPMTLAVDSGPNAAFLGLIGLGVAAGGLFLAGFVTLLAARRGPRAEAAKA